jgi:hypothetical protein
MEKKRQYPQQGFAMTCRSYAEYSGMFDLREQSLQGVKILDAAGGASSFTAEVRALGADAYAADPLYAYAPGQLAERGREEIRESAGKLAVLADLYDWSFYGSLENHQRVRLEALGRFLQDYEANVRNGRYVEAALPDLPFADGEFDLVLCSHFLFLYREQLGEAFHRMALKELLRVCRKGGSVRIYPLVDLSFGEFPGLSEWTAELEAAGVRMNRVPARLRFLPGSSEFLLLEK